MVRLANRLRVCGELASVTCDQDRLPQLALDRGRKRPDRFTSGDRTTKLEFQRLILDPSNHSRSLTIGALVCSVP